MIVKVVWSNPQFTSLHKNFMETIFALRLRQKSKKVLGALDDPKISAHLTESSNYYNQTRIFDVKLSNRRLTLKSH